MIQPVHGIPALCADDALIIGDLHIGIEAHLLKKGVHLTSRTENMLSAINAASTVNTDRIIVIGDVKDSVPGSSFQEFTEIPAFFDSLLENYSKVEVVRGNHDTELERFLPYRVRVHPATGMRFGDLGLVHGHTWPSSRVMSSKILVMGHEHPTVLFKDGIGSTVSEPCWLRGRFRQDVPDSRYTTLPDSFIVVPAFNRLLGGSPINIIGDQLLGPVLNSDLVDLDSAHIYLLDGLDLGKRSENMVSDNRVKRRISERASDKSI